MFWDVCLILMGIVIVCALFRFLFYDAFKGD